MGKKNKKTPEAIRLKAIKIWNKSKGNKTMKEIGLELGIYGETVGKIITKYYKDRQHGT